MQQIGTVDGSYMYFQEKGNLYNGEGGGEKRGRGWGVNNKL